MCVHAESSLSVPSPPENFSVSSIIRSPLSLSASWGEPSARNGIIESFTVRCSRLNAGGSDTTTISTTVVNNGSVFSVTIEGLTPYTDYSCTISATTGAGEGNSSDAQIARTDEDGMKIYIIW